MLILLLSLVSCTHNPPSEKAVAAGLLTHAKHHNEQRTAGKEYTSSEEFTAKFIGDNTAGSWDIYQSDNTAFNMTIKDAQLYLDKSHAKINESFPKDKKPFASKK